MKNLETIRGMAEEHGAEKASPISKIPNEILGLIFKELKRGDCFHKYAWWKILLVSRHWKNVADEDASLWAKIPTHNHTGTLCMLKRSRTSLLDVRINHWTATAATVSAVLNHVHRIGQLAIGNGAWHEYDLQARLQEAGNAPSKLKVLSIDFFSYNQYHVLGTPPLPPLHAQTLQHLVSLQELDFSLGVKYDWNIFPIPGLKVLSLTDSTPTNAPTWAQFQRALHRMPALEDVRFNFEDLSLTSAGPPHEAVISMLKLQKIFVGGGSLSVIGYFFSQTKLPALQHAIVRSNYDGSIEKPDLYEHAIRVVLSLLSRSAFGFLDRMMIDIGGFRLITAAPPGFWLGDGLTFSCDCRLSSALMKILLNQLVAALPNRASHIAYLALTADTESQDLSELLGMLSHLKSIDVSASHAALLESLSMPLSLPRGGGAPASTVEDMTIGTELSVYDSQVAAGSLAHQLRDCLASRQQSGFTLRKLILCGKFTAAHVKIFRGIVGEVNRRNTHPTLSWATSSSEYTTDED